MLRLQSAKQGFLGTKNLDSTGGMLSQIDQGSGVRDQTSTDKFTDEDCEVWCDRMHAAFQVVIELHAVLR